MDNRVISACSPASASSVKSEQKLWETILASHGLSMRAGEHSQINTGFQGWNAFEPFDYKKPETNARQKFTNRQQAEKLLQLMAQGKSLRAAARELGLFIGAAHRTLKRYRENFTCSPAFESSEEGGSDVQ
jgi:DNA-binding NarL/FixJ family response regulator